MKKRLLALLTALAMILGCASVMAETTTETTGTATVKGFGGDITVTVTLDGADIKDVQITGDGETEGIGSKIINEWPNAFIEYNGIVDTYTGATFAGITREAVIAAMFLDGGMDVAKQFVVRYWTPLMEKSKTPPVDSKTKLQEWAMARKLPLPVYTEIGRTGSDHAPVFTMRVEIEGREGVCAEGKSKREASQAAAAELLKQLENK